MQPDHEIPAKSWVKNHGPKRILAIRLQAMGDLVITLPYLQYLRNALSPDTVIDLLTRKEVEDIPKGLRLFDHVYSIGGGRNGKKQLAHTLVLLPQLLLNRYQVVMDLQNNFISRLVRRLLLPQAWSQFDRFGSVPAGECTRLAIEATGIARCGMDPGFRINTDEVEIKRMLKQNGWDGSSKLVVLNPAGAFTTRNWPIEYYVLFGNLWLEQFPRSQFLILGTGSISKKSDILKKSLGRYLIDLVNKTTPIEAFALLQNVHLVLSEDSGLMHMSWVSGVPTVAIFGSTRSDRARPLGVHSVLLDSSDLPCGNCMLENCRFADNRCLTRHTPSFVFEKAKELISHLYRSDKVQQSRSLKQFVHES